MAKRTGKDLAFTFATIALAVAREWTLEDEDVNTETTAAGDPMVDRESLRGDYTIDVNALLEVASPYVVPTAIRGTRIAWAGKIIASDANGFVGGTGLCTRFRLRVPYDGPVEVSLTVRGAGTALAYDLTPAS